MRFLVLIALALALAPAAAGAVPNPCALLTNAEVAKALGSKIESREPSGNGRYRACTWTGRNLSRPGFLPTHRTLMIQLTPSTMTQFDAFARRTPGAVRVSSVGEAAYSTTGTAKSLEVWQHGYALFIVASVVIDPIATAKTAAKLAVKRL